MKKKSLRKHKDKYADKAPARPEIIPLPRIIHPTTDLYLGRVALGTEPIVERLSSVGEGVLQVIEFEGKLVLPYMLRHHFASGSRSELELHLERSNQTMPNSTKPLNLATRRPYVRQRIQPPLHYNAGVSLLSAPNQGEEFEQTVELISSSTHSDIRLTIGNMRVAEIADESAGDTVSKILRTTLPYKTKIQFGAIEICEVSSRSAHSITG